ncbi:MAG: glycine zipper family protein [archaeon]
MIEKEKIVVGIEILLMIFSVFAFSYILYSTSPIFEVVSADGLEDLNIGCCALTTTGAKCASVTEDLCRPEEYFSPNVLCSSAYYCQKGCCYDDVKGLYDRNVLERDCNLEKRDWISDPNCNLPGADLGCCVLGEFIQYETYGQCVVDSKELALGGEEVDWRTDLNEMECFALLSGFEDGACVLSGGNCKFGGSETCNSLGGEFFEGYLCSSSLLETDCEKTTETMCVDGKYGVYFKDSCGNPANIYDADKANQQSYWERVVDLDETCGVDSVSGNMDSASCGNCNIFIGSVCDSSIGTDVNPDMGDNYCRDVSCELDGVRYKNGESWCVYDGAIGNGDGVVGSRHWKYVCSQGKINVEPCEDYRNEICIQSNTEVEDEVVFRNGNCVANNWRNCISINSEYDDAEERVEECSKAVNCMVENIDVADYFDFDVCVPKYPGGFDLRDIRYQDTSEMICGQATQNCTVYREEKFFGGCKYVANENCLSEEFGQKMNDFCRKLGDCGGEVNIAGKFVKNYKLSDNIPDLSSNWIAKLKLLANVVPGQFAPVESYEEYLMASGLLPSDYSSSDYEVSDTISDVSAGIGGIGTAAGLASSAGILTTSASTTTAVAGFSGAAIGAGIGMMAGLYLAKELGVSPIGTVMMAVGGALVGGVIGYYVGIGTMLLSIPAVGVILIVIGLIIMIIGAFLAGSDCDAIEVSYECKVWQPPKGGEDCEICNNDPMKICSKYRCESLGGGCQFLNYDAENEEYYMCANSCVTDPNPPNVEPMNDFISPGIEYADVSEDGFSLTSEDGGCLDAYTILRFGLNTNEPALCRLDVEEKDFEEMGYDVGGNFYLYNHTMFFPIPDPSHGQSQGWNWNGELEFFVKCQDACGHETPNFYHIDMCVNQGPDNNPPVIMYAEPKSDSLIGFDSNSTSVQIMTNELSSCRWDESDKDYSSMANSFECKDRFGIPGSPYGYVCSGELPTKSLENKFYIRCGDQPWLIGKADEGDRNFNFESYSYVLKKPDKKISIDWILPDEDFETSTSTTSVDLKVQTSGGGEYHFCSYSFSGYEKMIPMFETGADRIHTQPALNLQAGEWNVYVECKDETGDFVRGETNFEIIYDEAPPLISRIWQDAGEIFIFTVEESECRYSENSCSFSFDDGIKMDLEIGFEHVIEAVMGREYFVKCKDGFGNVPSGCSARVIGI